MGTDLEIRCIQGTETAVTFTFSAGFQGTETLSFAVGVGDNQAAIATYTPTWTAGQTTGSYTQADLTITAAQSAALPWGIYTVDVTVGATTVAAVSGVMTVYPGPGGTGRPFQRLLASPAMATSYLPSLTRDSYDSMSVALVAATRAVEGYCQYPLVLDSYDHFIRPNNSNKLRLRSRPVVELSRCAGGMTAAFWVGNTTADLATVNTVLTGPASLTPSSLVFISTVSGTATTQSLTVASYTTVTALVTAINALGNGWSASLYGSVGSYPASELVSTVGARDARYGRPEFFLCAQPLSEYRLDNDAGRIEINQAISGGFLVPNPRIEIRDTRLWGVRTTYRAGYAFLKADSDLGYYTVPEDLAVATIMTAQAILEGTQAVGPVKSQTVKDRSYTLKDAHSAIPDAAKALLARYAAVVI